MILYSKIFGKGKPLIILHGLFGMGDNWKTLAKYFTQYFEVHLVDQRNHGRSFHHNDFSYDLLAEDLHTYITHYNLKDINILGHSMGGKTAMFFSVKHEIKIQKLIVVDMSPKFYSIQKKEHSLILNGLNSLQGINSRKEAEIQLSVFVKEDGARQFLLKNLYWDKNNKLIWRFNLPVLTKQINQLYKGLSSEMACNKPTLFLRGSESEYIKNTDRNVIKKLFPKAKIQTISNSGHWIHVDNPNEFYKSVINFLNPL